jgi:CheY-like chemotaxis protein
LTVRQEKLPHGWRLAQSHSVDALVVDDVEDNREVLSGFLARVGINVRKATNGAEALDRIAEQQPDVVFMDVRMPVMDGLEAVQQIRSRWSDPSIICVAITASGLLRRRDYYLQAGFDDFISKPFRFETICECMIKHLGIEIEEEPAVELAVGCDSEMTALADLQLADDLRNRLLAAAQINALTEIEALILELKGLGAPAQSLVDKLEVLVAHYDMEGIIELVEQLPQGPS